MTVTIRIVDTEYLDRLEELFFSDNPEIKAGLAATIDRIRHWRNVGTYSEDAAREFMRSTVSYLIQVTTDIVRPSTTYVHKIADELLSYHNLLGS